MKPTTTRMPRCVEPFDRLDRPAVEALKLAEVVVLGGDVAVKTDRDALNTEVLQEVGVSVVDAGSVAADVDAEASSYGVSDQLLPVAMHERLTAGECQDENASIG